ncbi:ligase-associated DNA damage response DEXH box helicase [Haloferula rosea]|uniref:Ligase-associated DNA damage response DEXH box helicase n=1 Tax=Haloferula rosea TaxID=490093 RepID=A0A934RC52_9BACT|nr:ligase-associated DNA damage response DEXH box helicase [Haloferula rosea]MBK1827948.1 ligase-associated DNA damage response DEXH box helicase [Haloferula rosea]
MKTAPTAAETFFAKRQWKPHDFQLETWQAYREGRSGLLHAPTGLGKTLAVWMGPVNESLGAPRIPTSCQVLWITPLRALAKDTARSLQEPLDELDAPLEVALRTGDTSSYRKAKLREKLPFALVTTPESLSLMLTYGDSRTKLSKLKCVVVDEWHELLGTKRGVQTELCLARLKQWAPDLRVWGVSATLGNLDEAKESLHGARHKEAAFVHSTMRKPLRVETMIPREIDRFPWAGHLGIRLVKRVAKALHRARSSLVFTNTRSQSEIWHQSLIEADPSLKSRIAIHHGSISREDRLAAEQGLLEGTLLAVVCTSSLDLGIDFAPVEQVIQIGSPKGVARLLQRAGRSGHQPGKASRLLCIPTNAMELLEFAAAQDALDARELESRRLQEKPLDLLVQHVATCAIGEALDESDFAAEIRSTHSYRKLDDADWQWVLGFVSNGGDALRAYPHYRKVERKAGKLHFTDKRMIQLHRMNIGTITSDVAVSLRFKNGQKLGTVEEGFITKLRPGAPFVFGGRLLELVRVRDLIATVQPSSKKNVKGEVVIWGGSKMPLSTELAHAVARRLNGQVDTPRAEVEAVSELLDIQARWSSVPTDSVLQVEHALSRQGEHLFFYTFAGRLVNEGIGTLAAHRLTDGHPQSVQVTQNDYGFCLTSTGKLPLDEARLREILRPEQLLDDLLKCLNTHELARRKFREVARVAGLIQQSQPGKRKGMRNIQTSASLLYEVFTRYDPDNLLLDQSKREILEGQLEFTRMQEVLSAMADKSYRLIELERLTPMAFPLWAERLHSTISTKDALTLMEEMLAELEREADKSLSQ